MKTIELVACINQAREGATPTRRSDHESVPERKFVLVTNDRAPLLAPFEGSHAINLVRVLTLCHAVGDVTRWRECYWYLAARAAKQAFDLKQERYISGIV